MNKKDAGTIFNPVMFLVILILTAQLLLLFVEYKKGRMGIRSRHRFHDGCAVGCLYIE